MARSLSLNFLLLSFSISFPQSCKIWPTSSNIEYVSFHTVVFTSTLQAPYMVTLSYLTNCSLIALILSVCAFSISSQKEVKSSFLLLLFSDLNFSISATKSLFLSFKISQMLTFLLSLSFVIVII